jgi:hypothetical protein
MPRLITARKTEAERDRADQFIKQSVLIPSALLGFIALVLGYGAVIYLLFDRPATAVAIDSSVLLLTGAAVGLAQAFYQGFLSRTYPDHFARKQRRREMLRSGNVRKIEAVDPIAHPGRGWVLLLYVVLFGLYVGLAVVYAGKLNTLAAVFLPLAGFYNARFFYWKRRFPNPGR